MRKILFLFLCSLVLTNTGWAQSLSDQQVLQYAVQQKKAGKSEADIVIYFTDYKSEAGWKKNAKKHMMY